MTVQSVRRRDTTDTTRGAWWPPAREGEPAQAWAELVGGPTAGPVFGVSGHALTAGAPADPAPGTRVRVLDSIEVAGHPWTLLELPGAPHPAPPPQWRIGVAEVRLGLSLWLRDRAVRRLRGRKVGGTALVHQQLVRARLAEAATEQAMAESLLDDLAAQPHARDALHLASRHLIAADRILLRLFGAYGFLGDGPGQVVLLSELMADAYLEPMTKDEGEGRDDRVG